MLQLENEEASSNLVKDSESVLCNRILKLQLFRKIFYRSTFGLIRYLTPRLQLQRPSFDHLMNRAIGN